jgi:hypothetical protein
MEKTTPLRPHTVLGRHGYGGDVHALAMTTGDFAGIVFSYTDVSFKEETLDDEDKLKIKFEYHVHEVPLALKNYDKDAFEKELGDFLVELLYYGLERDFLGFIDGEQDRANDSFKPGSQ